MATQTIKNAKGYGVHIQLYQLSDADFTLHTAIVNKNGHYVNKFTKWYSLDKAVKAFEQTCKRHVKKCGKFDVLT